MSSLLALATGCDASDDAVVAQTLDGDSRRFAVLAMRHVHTVYRAVRSILREDGEAEDALQQALVCAFRHLRAFERGPLVCWLLPIAIDEAHARHVQRMRLEAGRREARGLHAPPSGVVAVVSPEVRELEAALDDLPEAYRLVLVLRDVCGLGTEDVARVLEVTPSNVRVRIFRAREALRRAAGDTSSMGGVYAIGGRRPARIVLTVMHDIFSESAVTRVRDAG